MKIQVISDIHGSAADLRAALEGFERVHGKADLLLLCGDYLNHGPRNTLPAGYDTKAAAALLNEHAKRIVGVRGNCDSEVDQMMLSFPCLAPYVSLFLGGGERPVNAAFETAGEEAATVCQRVFVHHGHLYDTVQLASWLPASTLVVSGHTHVPVLERDEKTGLVLFNPGSISIPKSDEGKTYGVIESDAWGIRRIALCALSGSVLREVPF